MVTLPQPGDPVEDPPKQPSQIAMSIRWGLLALLLIIFGGGYVLDFFF